MVCLDITAEEKAKALATLEDENDKKVSAKWKNPDGAKKSFGVKSIKEGNGWYCELPEAKEASSC